MVKLRQTPLLKPVVHGGHVTAAAKQYGVPLSQWVDLSTGISPWPYPVSEIPQKVWKDLPWDSQALIDAAARYYQCEANIITPVAGSQDAIARLPMLLQPSTVAIPQMGYQEHQQAWLAAGHKVVHYSDTAELPSWLSTKKVEHVVVINPNNPLATYCSCTVLQSIQQVLGPDSVLIVDEAFMDMNPQQSMVTQVVKDNVLVLRSVGKFFGLAGLRLGFVMGTGDLVVALGEMIAPWGVSHIALYVGEQALSDSLWQQSQSQRISQQQPLLLKELLTLSHYLDPQAKRLNPIAQLPLLTTLMGETSVLQPVFHAAAKQGILLRYDEVNEHQAWLRFGLPTDKQLPILRQFIQHYCV